MTRTEINIYLAAILTTALETEPEVFPESLAYLVLSCNLDSWATLKEIMLHNELATFAGHSITLTDKGRALAVKCNEVKTKES